MTEKNEYKKTKKLSKVNTILADINEISFGYLMAENWNKVRNLDEAISTLEKRIQQVKEHLEHEADQAIADQIGRAKAMKKAVQSWTAKHGFTEIEEIWWTARPGVLSTAAGWDVDWKNNPTDILLKYEGDSLLGISAKSTARKRGITFKNPGVGTLSTTLETDLVSTAIKMEEQIAFDNNLPPSKKARKKFIRERPDTQLKTVAGGKLILNTLRNSIFATYEKMPQEDLRAHLVRDWMNATPVPPQYVRVTGRGKCGNYSATLDDPLDNPLLKALNSAEIYFHKLGSDSIGIEANGYRIMKIRLKYESEKIASSIKLSGEPWSGSKIF